MWHSKHNFALRKSIKKTRILLLRNTSIFTQIDLNLKFHTVEFEEFVLDSHRMEDLIYNGSIYMYTFDCGQIRADLEHLDEL